MPTLVPIVPAHDRRAAVRGMLAELARTLNRIPSPPPLPDHATRSDLMSGEAIRRVVERDADTSNRIWYMMHILNGGR
jgi:hypothetical protein